MDLIVANYDKEMFTRIEKAKWFIRELHIFIMWKSAENCWQVQSPQLCILFARD